ncbi:LysR family transcriptional regulator [Neobacillus sp. CF12]|uniref:LysR family transcriptional regulator n=1 Tax=Neobacillus sp. CF12 TaxID=3055864 RepID=UPI0025A23374|nr:LysR family transcriptional regulator [Neobacillus sp. CF12]MDM5327733.1 LysR family transcriptional regulator [Neobacillus sp. CF12]
MHIQKLEVLVEVAKTRSISIASQNLHMSQSGISQTITKIEEELGIKIFVRSRLGAILTPDGTNIVKKADELLLKYEELMNEARKSSEIHSGKLRISTVPAFINFLLKPLKEIRNLYPHSTIEFLEQITESTVEFVRQGKTDIGLICLYEDILKKIEDLHFEVILEGKMKVYVGSDSPFASKKTITPEEILQQEVVLYNGDYIKWFIHHFQLTFGKMNILFSSNNTEELLRSISDGLAISFAPDIVMKNNPLVLAGKIVDVDIINYAPINTALGFIHQKKKRPSEIERHYIRFLKSEMNKYFT